MEQEMGWTRGTYGGEGNYVQGFGEETQRIQPTWKMRAQMQGQ